MLQCPTMAVPGAHRLMAKAFTCSFDTLPPPRDIMAAACAPSPSFAQRAPSMPAADRRRTVRDTKPAWFGIGVRQVTPRDLIDSQRRGEPRALRSGCRIAGRPVRQAIAARPRIARVSPTEDGRRCDLPGANVVISPEGEKRRIPLSTQRGLLEVLLAHRSGPYCRARSGAWTLPWRDRDCAERSTPRCANSPRRRASRRGTRLALTPLRQPAARPFSRGRRGDCDAAPSTNASPWNGRRAPEARGVPEITARRVHDPQRKRRS